MVWQCVWGLPLILLILGLSNIRPLYLNEIVSCKDTAFNKSDFTILPPVF